MAAPNSDARRMGGRTLRAAASRAGAERGADAERGAGHVRWRRTRSQRGGQSRPARLGALGQKAVTFRQEEHIAFCLGVGHCLGDVEGFRFKLSPALHPACGLSELRGGVSIVCRPLIVRRHGAPNPCQPRAKILHQTCIGRRGSGHDGETINRTQRCGHRVTPGKHQVGRRTGKSSRFAQDPGLAKAKVPKRRRKGAFERGRVRGCRLRPPPPRIEAPCS